MFIKHYILILLLCTVCIYGLGTAVNTLLSLCKHSQLWTNLYQHSTVQFIPRKGYTCHMTNPLFPENSKKYIWEVPMPLNSSRYHGFQAYIWDFQCPNTEFTHSTWRAWSESCVPKVFIRKFALSFGSHCPRWPPFRRWCRGELIFFFIATRFFQFWNQFCPIVPSLIHIYPQCRTWQDASFWDRSV